MTVDGVTSSGNLNSSLFTSFVDNPDSALGKQDFLQLLVTKLKYQDPLKPMSDNAFIADLAQFSSLEQMTNLNSSFLNQASALDNLNENIIGLMMMQNTTQAAGLIGRNVVVEIDSIDPNTGEAIKSQVSGQVDIVRFVDGQPRIVVNGNEYSLASVKEITA